MKDFIRSFFSMFTSLTVLIPILFGLPFLGFGTNELYKTYRDVQVFVEAEGTVIYLNQSTDEDGTAYAPVVEFTTRDGQQVSYVSNFYSNPPDFEVGDAVDMLYNASDASEARINTWVRLWLFPIILTSIGLVAIGIGLSLGLFGSGGPFNPKRLS